MQRRDFVWFAALRGAGAQAQVKDISDAINKAGRQRMLSQRMGKAWFCLALGVDTKRAKIVMEQSSNLFERQLEELKAYAPSAEVRETYTALESAWAAYKVGLQAPSSDKSAANQLLQLDAKVLALAHKGTVQYEAASAKAVGKLVNIAGRQRMLSQRMAKFYFAAHMRADAASAQAEIGKAHGEFLSALEVLRNAPEASGRIREELSLADAQLVFFDDALKRMGEGSAKSDALSNVFVSSENLLAVMDKITGLYAAI